MSQQASPHLGLIEHIQNLLLNRPRTHQIECVLIRESHHFGDALTHFGGCFRFPFFQFGVQFFKQYVYGVPPCS